VTGHRVVLRQAATSTPVEEEVAVDERREDPVPVYEPPVLVEVGAFAELTHGDQIGDYYDGVYLNWGAGT
jgi:hypothetical protein